MIARTVTLRELVLEDCARVADLVQRPAVARLLRRADVSTLDCKAAAMDLRPRSAHAAALAALGSESFGADLRAAMILADECGLSIDDWTDETCIEQGVEVPR